MTFGLFIRRYWRIPLLAVLTAAVAFAASFIEKPSYTSSTRMLIVAGSTTSLNSTGEPLSSQSGVVDTSALAQTLSETQAGLASSREVAVMVVDQLHLDAPKPPPHGPIHMLEAAAASAYAHLRGWVTAGFYRSPSPREKAIQTTEKAIVASDVAPAGGPQTGQANSFILELDASGETAVQAQLIADAAADALVTVSRERFEHDSQFYADALAAQLKQADGALSSDNEAVANYELAHNISSLDQQIVQNVQDSGSLNSQVIAANATVEADKQTVASLQATLSSTDPSETTQQNITTGRSTTADDTLQANPVYQTVQGQLSQAQATLAADSAKASSLQGQQQTNASAPLTQAQAGLLDLEEQVTADQNSIQTLSGTVAQANANVQISPVELSRLGGADLPTYPSSPKRYLYLLIGLLLGALAGGGLTHLAARRRQLGPDGGGDHDADLTVHSQPTMELFPRPVPQQVPAGVGASNGAGGTANGTNNGSDADDSASIGDLFLSEGPRPHERDPVRP